MGLGTMRRADYRRKTCGKAPVGRGSFGIASAREERKGTALKNNGSEMGESRTVQRFIQGSSASRRPSPRKLNASTVRESIAAGKISM